MAAARPQALGQAARTASPARPLAALFAALALSSLLPSCLSAPKPERAAARPLPAPEAPLPPPPPRVDKLGLTLAEFSRRELPGGARLVLRRLEGRRLAAAELCLLPEAGEADSEGGVPGADAEGNESSGIEALALLLAARGEAGQKAPSLPSLLAAAGASLELKSLDGGTLALELVAPREELSPCLAALARALAWPAFLSGLSDADFAAAKRGLELAALRREADPELRAKARLEAALAGGRLSSPLGDSKGLRGLDANAVAERWRRSVGPARLRIAVVGDLEPEELAATLSEALAAMAAPSRGEAADPAARAEAAGQAGSVDKAGPAGQGTEASHKVAPAGPILELIPSSEASFLRAAFPAPSPSSPDRPAFFLALSLFADLASAPPEGSEGLAGLSVESGLVEGASPSGYIALKGTFSPAEGRALIERELSLLAKGSAPLLRGRDFEAAKARALARLYSGGDSSAELARAVALDLASGGDGASACRVGAALEAATPADVARITREQLSRSSILWAAAAAKGELARFSETVSEAAPQ